MKTDYHAGRRAPDKVLAVGHCIVFTQLSPHLDPVPLMVGRIEKKGEGNLKHLGNLERVRHQLERWRNETNNRCHLEAGSCPVLGKAAKKLDVPAVQIDLFFCLAQSGVDRGSILLFDTPPRKTDLSGMVMKVIRTTCQ
jgi:hypothetical protein